MPIEPWDFIAANGIGFFEGSAISYLCRWQRKGGVADLLKAKHFIEKLVALQQPQQPTPQLTEPSNGESETECVCPRVRRGECKYRPCALHDRNGCRCQTGCYCPDCVAECNSR